MPINNPHNPSPSSNEPKYSESIGSMASKARAMGEYMLSRSGLVEDAENKIRELIALFRSDRIPDEFKKDTAEIRMGLTSVLGELVSLGFEWRLYTAVYSSGTGSDPDDVLKLNNDEEAGAARFAAQLKDTLRRFEELEALELNRFSAFSEAFAEIRNISGHYEEMTNGSLKVPENPEYHIRALDPDVKTSGKNAKKNVVNETYKYIRKDNLPLFPHEPSPDDIMQGSIGDCWLVSTLSAICVNNPQAIRDMIKDNMDGTVTVRLYAEKNDSYVPYYITVEKTVPQKETRKTNGQVVNRTVANNTSLWVQMIEKAYAASGLHIGKFNSKNKAMNMENIKGGFNSRAVNALFGGLNVDHKEIDNIKSDHEFFLAVKDAVAEKRIITSSTTQFSRSSNHMYEKYKEKVDEYKRINKRAPDEEEKKNMAEEASYGLPVRSISDFSSLGITYENHAYTVVNAIEKNGEKYIVIRNPHGKKAYNALGNGEQDKTAGYSTIPLKEFRKLFVQTIISTPVAVDGYKNPAEEIVGLTRTMIKAFDNSRSITSYITLRHSMSDQFKEMYDAMELVNNIAGSRAPSKLALIRAFDDLSVKADRYLNYTNANPNSDSDRNLRVTIAKACSSLAEAYKNSEGEKLAAGVTNVTRNILKDRILYFSSTSQDDTIRKMHDGKAIDNVIEKLKDKDLYTSITQLENYAKAASEVQPIKENPAGPVHNSDNVISPSVL